MDKTKLLATVLITGLLTSSLAGCGNDSPAAAEPPNPPAANEPAAPQPPVESDAPAPETDAQAPADETPEATPAPSGEAIPLTEVTPIAQLPAEPVTALGLTIDTEALAGLDNTSSGWGHGNNVDDRNRPLSATKAQANYGQYDADFIAPDTATVYLTIDEGYENGYTAQILDVLRDKQCPAVFFVTLPYVKSNPELVQRMIDEGHVVGNHSVTHPSDGLPSQTLQQQANELTELHQYMRDNYGYEMYLFRYPAGIHSQQSLALVQQLGYRSVFWSFAYRDWVTDDQPDPAESLAKLNKKMHPGAIYLLHAVSATNTEIMGQFIDDTRAAGYAFGVYPQRFGETAAGTPLPDTGSGV